MPAKARHGYLAARFAPRDQNDPGVHCRKPPSRNLANPGRRASYHHCFSVHETLFRRVMFGEAIRPCGGQKQERLVRRGRVGRLCAGSLSRADTYHKPLKLKSVLGATDTAYYCYRAQATAFKQATDAMRLRGTTVSLRGYHARWSLNGRVSFAAQL
jgi:hypothetical protein